MAEQVVPYKHDKASKKTQVAAMFDSIAGRYDFMNRFLSVGIDVYWRKKALNYIRKYVSKPAVLDVATGTGDFAIQSLSLNPRKVVGVDISEGMLRMGREKLKRKGLDERIKLLKGDSEKLNFEDNSFDVVTVAFGVRNFENLEAGLSEIRRVLAPGGRVLILEFSKVKSPLIRFFYNFYFNVLTPLWGKLLARNREAYSYLPASVDAFPSGRAFTDILEKLNYKSVRCIPFTFGVCSAYIGEK